MDELELSFWVVAATVVAILVGMVATRGAPASHEVGAFSCEADMSRWMRVIGRSRVSVFRQRLEGRRARVVLRLGEGRRCILHAIRTDDAARLAALLEGAAAALAPGRHT